MKALYLLPNQLFLTHAFDCDLIVLHEHSRYFTDFKFHKQKLILHRASMKAYVHHLQEQKIRVVYVAFDESLVAALKKHSINYLFTYDPVDESVAQELLNLQKTFQITIHDSPLFLLSAHDAQEFLGDGNHYSMNSFYIKQRKHLDILMVNGKPMGNKYSFDAENRKKMPENTVIPDPWHPKQNQFVIEAKNYIDRHFPSNPGNVEQCIYPITHKDANKWFENFLQHRFEQFGIYQDAMVENEPFLFHSLLSPLLNIGLLDVREVVEKIVEHGKQHKIALNSIEGLLRQIIGWREFVRAVYLKIGHEQRTTNFFSHNRPLTTQFWEFKTDILPIDDALKSIYHFGYAHHIQRLMVLGNFMLLCETKPNDVYTWFMEMFVDAYDWVMVPNVYGMSQYADGGRMITKPYMSSSNYILKMSNYSRGPWCKLWDALYWRFVIRNLSILQKNPRLAFMTAHARNMSKDTLNSHIKLAEKYLNLK